MTRKLRGTTQRKVTIADVARDSNVSPATVSLVLRDKPGVGTQTRKRVWETARKMGYVPPASRAHAETSAETWHIGLVIKLNPDDAHPTANLFYSPVMAGIEQVCRQHNSRLLYASMQADAHNVSLEAPRLLTDDTIDGLILVGMQLTHDMQAHLHQIGIPVVLIDAYSDDNNFDAVVSDNERGAFDAVEYLIGQGHKRIALVGTEPDSYLSVLERRWGYVRAIETHELDPLFADSRYFAADAANAALALLAEHPDITAFLVANDELAIEVMEKISESGASIPGDISVVGFDDIVLSQHIKPALTTMQVDKTNMGRLAVQLLFNRIEHPLTSRVEAILRPRLIERDSVAPLLKPAH